MAHWLRCFALASLCMCGHAAAITLDRESEKIPLWSALQVVGDPSKRHTPAEVEAIVATGNASRLPHANHAYGTWLPYPYWAHFTLKNPSPEAQSWWITYELPTQDEATLWIKNAHKQWVEYSQAEKLRPYALSSGQLYPAWRLQLQGHQEVQLLLRIDGYNLMRFPMFAVSDLAFASTQNNLHLGIGFVLAVPLVVVLYVLTLIPVAADRSLPLFLVMAGCEMLGALWISGVLHELLPWLDRWQAGWVGWTGYVALLGLSCQHARIFLDTKERSKVADDLLRAGAWVWLVAVPLLAWTWPQASRLVLVMGGTLHAFAMTWLALYHYRRNPAAHRMLFMAVWVVYAFSGVLYMLYRLVELPIHVTLISNFVQGSLVAALLGCAVSVQILRKQHLLQANMNRAQDRGLLYAAAQHDLWQPLQSVGLYAQSLRSSAPDQHEKILQGMEAAMASVNEFMLSMREIASTERPPQLQAVSLHAILMPVIQEFRQWTQPRLITLRYQRVDRLVLTDPQILQRIVRNLLSNALRYTNEGGRILIGCRRQQGKLWLMVMDTGIGMSEADASRCFTAFQRFGEPERVPEGMGIGLYSVKRMATLLGQETTLRSTPGKGTAIGVSLLECAEESSVNLCHPGVDKTVKNISPSHPF